MEKNKLVDKKNLIHYGVTSAILFTIAFLFSACITIFSTAFEDSTPESMSLAISEYINSGSQTYAYSEVHSDDPEENYHNSETASLLAFGNWWRFSTGPNNKLLRKFIPKNDHSPLVLHTSGGDYSPTVFSNGLSDYYGNYFDFEVFQENLNWSDYVDPRYIFLSESLALEIAQAQSVDFLDLVGMEFETTTTSNIFGEADNSKIIAGIIKRISYSPYIDVFGEDFVYVCPNNYYLRDYCNQVIGVIFKNNLVGNRTTLRDYLRFKDYRSSYILFYDKTDGGLSSDGFLQTNYMNCLRFYSDGKDLATATAFFVVSVVLLVALVTMFAVLKKKGADNFSRKPSLYLITLLISFFISFSILNTIQRIPFYDFVFPTANRSGFLISFVAVAEAVISMLLLLGPPFKKSQTTVENTRSLYVNTGSKASFKMILAGIRNKKFWIDFGKHFALLCLVAFLAYLLIFAFQESTRSTLLTSAIFFIGSTIGVALLVHSNVSRIEIIDRTLALNRLLNTFLMSILLMFLYPFLYFFKAINIIWIAGFDLSLSRFFLSLSMAVAMYLFFYVVFVLVSMKRRKIVRIKGNDRTIDEIDFYKIDI